MKERTNCEKIETVMRKKFGYPIMDHVYVQKKNNYVIIKSFPYSFSIDNGIALFAWCKAMGYELNVRGRNEYNNDAMEIKIKINWKKPRCEICHKHISPGALLCRACFLCYGHKGVARK